MSNNVIIYITDDIQIDNDWFVIRLSNNSLILHHYNCKISGIDVDALHKYSKCTRCGLNLPDYVKIYILLQKIKI